MKKTGIFSSLVVIALIISAIVWYFNLPSDKEQ